MRCDRLGSRWPRVPPCGPAATAAGVAVAADIATPSLIPVWDALGTATPASLMPRPLDVVMQAATAVEAAARTEAASLSEPATAVPCQAGSRQLAAGGRTDRSVNLGTHTRSGRPSAQPCPAGRAPCPSTQTRRPARLTRARGSRGRGQRAYSGTGRRGGGGAGPPAARRLRGRSHPPTPEAAPRATPVTQPIRRLLLFLFLLPARSSRPSPPRHPRLPAHWWAVAAAAAGDVTSPGPASAGRRAGRREHCPQVRQRPPRWRSWSHAHGRRARWAVPAVGGRLTRLPVFARYGRHRYLLVYCVH